MAKRGRPRKDAIYQPGTAPSTEMQERAKDFLTERIRASRKVVNSRKNKWKLWNRMYSNEQIYSRQEGESNLVLPKADYIVETLSSKVINTIFSVSEWITMKHPAMNPEQLKAMQTWFMYVMDRKVNFYLTAIELFKASPIKGTSVCKTYLKNMWPCVEFMKLENFLPDPLANRPGDINSMRYCGHQFKRDFNQIKSFKSAVDGKSLYFNLDKLQEIADMKKNEAVKKDPDSPAIEDKTVPIFDIIEYHGDFEYQQGKFSNFIMSCIIPDETSEKPQHIIRLEPATFKTYDQFLDDWVILKPFVANIYSVNPGEFYGKSAIESVESLIFEQTDLHNIYMDNYKRLINGITKVLNRSTLTRKDLPQVPGALWFMDSFEDVEMEEPKPTNLMEYRAMHELLDREIEKTSSVTAYNLGVGRTKRETYGEVRSMLSEAGDRYTTFIQMADRCTLRQLGINVYELIKQTMAVLGETTFLVNGQQIGIDPTTLVDDMDVSFATTTIESEYSKYAKQQSFPNFVNMLATVAGPRINIDEIVKEGGDLFNYKNPERFLTQSDQIPIAALPPEVQPIAQQILMALQQQRSGGGNGGAKIMPSLPSAGGSQFNR